uniref:hypothetical protein n=1 Tax=Petrachloros mirabilis TaxID=2918835 RepID=UPI001EE79697|nr:hypothetical protein [Petrachloros mirabilis]
MLAQLRRLVRRFFRKSSTIDREPINKVSLIVIILIDIFILVNVFSGLDDIGRWPLSPSQAYPCYSEWQNYRADTRPTVTKTNALLRQAIQDQESGLPSFRQRYEQGVVGHLGQLSDTCLAYADHKDAINTSANQERLQGINQRQASIDRLTQANREIREQYDSSLLEQIAGQEPGQSILGVQAAAARETLEQNDRQIATLETEISRLEQELRTTPESETWLATLNDEATFNRLQRAYEHSSFWHPSGRFLFQALFLLPLIALALWVHITAQSRNYGLISLMSWHLLVIFCVPLLFKLFEFLQVGVIFQFLAEAVTALLGGLLFLVNYLYILLIPLMGFGIIKLFQQLVFNTKRQAANRVQKSKCIRCARKLHPQDAYCPHCGFYQWVECSECHGLTYCHLPYCRLCGTGQTPHFADKVPVSTPEPPDLPSGTSEGSGNEPMATN